MATAAPGNEVPEAAAEGGAGLPLHIGGAGKDMVHELLAASGPNAVGPVQEVRGWLRPWEEGPRGLRPAGLRPAAALWLAAAAARLRRRAARPPPQRCLMPAPLVRHLIGFIDNMDISRAEVGGVEGRLRLPASPRPTCPMRRQGAHEPRPAIQGCPLPWLPRQAHRAVLLRARERLLSVIGRLDGRGGQGKAQLERLLAASFAYLAMPDMREVPLAVMSRLERLPPPFLKDLAADTAVFRTLPPGVQRQVRRQGGGERPGQQPSSARHPPSAPYLFSIAGPPSPHLPSTRCGSTTRTCFRRTRSRWWAATSTRAPRCTGRWRRTSSCPPCRSAEGGEGSWGLEGLRGSRPRTAPCATLPTSPTPPHPRHRPRRASPPLRCSRRRRPEGARGPTRTTPTRWRGWRGWARGGAARAGRAGGAGAAVWARPRLRLRRVWAARTSWARRRARSRAAARWAGWW
jgi:hypothetical protein